MGDIQLPIAATIAIPFAGLALMFAIRELDFFLDRFFVDNLWQTLVAIIAALIIAYSYRQTRRFRVAWGRVWPSPGLAILFAGALIMFVFVQLVGHEPLWQSMLGDDYHRIVKVAVEEFIELMAYMLWLIGVIEYTYQARAIAIREPQPAAQRRRQRRRPRNKGQF